MWYTICRVKKINVVRWWEPYSFISKIEGPNMLKVYILSFYSNLYAAPTTFNVSITFIQPFIDSYIPSLVTNV